MSGKVRFHGIDTWRSLLLLGGPIVHAVGSEWSATPSPVSFQVIATGSHIFRMAAFFCIAGFLAALNQGKPGWLSGRFRQLLLPFCTMTVVMGIAVVGLKIIHFPHIMGFSDFPWHLWFLASLGFAAPIMVWLDQMGVNARVVAWAELRPAVFYCAGLVMTLLVGLAVSAFTRICVLAGIELPTILGILVKAPSDLCFYALGFYVARSPNCSSFLRSSGLWVVGLTMWTATMIAIYYANNQVQDDNAHSPVRLILLVMTMITEYTVSAAILANALNMRRAFPLAKKFSQSAYSIYLLHFPCIMVFGGVILTLKPDIREGLLYASLVVGSLALSYAAHRFVISQSRILLWLFNGRPLRKHPAERAPEVAAERPRGRQGYAEAA